MTDLNLNSELKSIICYLFSGGKLFQSLELCVSPPLR